MTPDPDPRLEDVARRRLTALLDAIEVGPPPAPPRSGDDGPVVHLGDLPGRGQPRRRHRTLVAVAALVAFVLGVGVAVVLRSAGGDGSSPPGAETGTTEVPHLVPGHLPDGAQPLYGTRLPMPAEELSPGSAAVTVYGRPGVEDPFAEGDLAVIVVEDETIGMTGTETVVRGGYGRFGESSEANDLGLEMWAVGDFRWVSWTETPDVEVTLASHSLAVPDLRALAEEAEVEGTTVELPASFQVLEPVGALRDLTFGGPALVPGTAEGWYDVYSRTDAGPPEANPTTPPLEVVTFTATADELLAIRWMIDAQPFPVRGFDGWIGMPADAVDAGQVTVLWEEVPGVIAITRNPGLVETLEAYRVAG